MHKLAMLMYVLVYIQVAGQTMAIRYVAKRERGRNDDRFPPNA